ncbi:VPA1269 family protein [Noviherbaspirillum sp.]|uniref:VPA1269 family protein n=1 Tax=Noviherbaspirillum sp. TaxID=1926288 RepID=UPI002FE2260E
MTYQYLLVDSSECYPSSIDGAEPVFFNPSNKHFALVKQPSLENVKALIEEYAELRIETGWEDLMEQGLNGGRSNIKFFNAAKKGLTHVSPAAVLPRLGIANNFQLHIAVDSLSAEEQIQLAAPLKPKNKAEMLALYVGSIEDQNGYAFFQSLANESTSGIEFFGRLIDDLCSVIANYELRNGKPPRHPTMTRTLEFLSLASSKGWLLFPFMQYDGEEKLSRILSTHWQLKYYWRPAYRSPIVDALLREVDEVDDTAREDVRFEKVIIFLMLCSTFRTYDQLSKELLVRCLDLIRTYPTSTTKTTPNMSRKALNALLRLRNSKFPNQNPLQPIAVGRGADTLDDYVSYQHLRDEYPDLTEWANSFEEWIKSVVDTQHGLRKTICNDLAKFIVQLPTPPRTPLNVLRAHINDATKDGNTFRNYVARLYKTPAPRNVRLQIAGQFFQFISDRARMADNAVWFPNPVDFRFDKFSGESQAQGSVRKAIGAHIMETMRQILIEDDYQWSKARTSWGHLVDKQTGRLEYVWCPSSALLLYMMLSVPLRGVQGRMLDSGEGDAEIYDFESERMIPNPNQLPVDGKIDTLRQEGILQVRPSGMVNGGDILALWITTNKTSEAGYFIPWVSEDLLKQLKYQRDWLFRYSDLPNMQSTSDGQGHRSAPEELSNVGGKFYCLFRDVFADQVHDHSLPVARQKTAKLWGQLCLEAQNRINAANQSGGRVILVVPGTENSTNPKAIHDLHSLRVSGITDLLDRGVPLNIVSEYVAGHATYIMTLWYDKPAPGAARRYLDEAHRQVGDKRSAVPSFTQDELIEHKPYLVTHEDFADVYNGFDALEENKGLAIVRHSGICPGTRCDEGAIDDRGRAGPVPIGDRGPSCPQCRFWLTGPAFLLGQTIEGNQLILKIRAKTASLTNIREKVMDAEDAGQGGAAEVLKGQADVEERQLNDMLTEWWHRMRFYEASRQKLSAYRSFLREADGGDAGHQEITVLADESGLPDPDWAVTRATNLELQHFLSTCAEFLPDGALDAKAAKQDVEIAVAKFLAINNKVELTAMYFTLEEDERLMAANLTVELLLQASKDPEHATLILEGKEKMAAIPNLQRGVEYLFGEGLTKLVKKKAFQSTRELNDEAR